MIKKIVLQNFKLFKEETAIPLSSINLLTGINGKGKSTLLQSMLLMRQSIDHNVYTKQILLNGNCIHIGSFSDLKNSSSSNSLPIIFKFFSEEGASKVNIEYRLGSSEDDDMTVDINEVIIISSEADFSETTTILKVDDRFVYKTGNSDEVEDIRFDDAQIIFENLIPIASGEFRHSIAFNEPPNFSKIHYISADRIGPQDFYIRSSLQKFPNVGSKGENTANILYSKSETEVHLNLYIDNTIENGIKIENIAKTLLIQSEVWLGAIFDGGKVDIKIEGNIAFIYLNSLPTKDRFKPANVGFGYSYILPIIVSGLIARPGEILIVENPEAHLHPRAQSRLALFLAKVAGIGVQVFIESHSDHILNAYRVAIAKKDLRKEDINILYFNNNPEPDIVRILIEEDGRIEFWPDNFFDQYDKDLDKLLGL